MRFPTFLTPGHHYKDWSIHQLQTPTILELLRKLVAFGFQPNGMVTIPFRSGFILTAVTSGSSARGHHYYGFIRLLAPHLVWLGFPHHTLVGQTHLRVLYFCRPRTIPELPRSASLPLCSRSDSNHMVYHCPFGLPQESAGSPPYTMPNRANLRFGPVVR